MSSTDRGVAARGFGRGLFPHQLSWLLHNPVRRLIIGPERLVDRLPLADDSVVLEVGPGSGYFSVALARRVHAGRLELLDVQPEMLAKAEARLRAAGCRNVGYTALDASGELPFRAETFDLALLVAVLGEIDDRSRALSGLFRALRPRGVLAVHEHVPDPDRVPYSQLHALAVRAGFRARSKVGPNWNYTALFER